MKFFLIALLTLCNYTLAKKAPKKIPLMTSAFSCMEGTKDAVCLHGKLPKDLDVVLLEYRTSKSCGAKTGESFKFSDEVVTNIDATRLVLDKGCKPGPSNFIGVIGNKTVKYKWLPLREEKPSPSLNASQQKIIEKSFRSGFSTARKDADYKKLYFAEGNPTYKLKASSTVAESSFKFLEYEMTCKDQTALPNGPFFLVMGDKLLPLTSFCSVMRGFFSVDGKTYASYSDSCCECGWHFDYISEIQSGKVNVIYGSLDFST